ncbi:hypothetical protein PR202_ga15777 [Eleusine coracana subsp. coracana]|uniref:Uncharacterized protein n=1 Tax=Eleusine coracana subsp. coracana TaxID=191504 RepID=A0AAV5CKZ2_ELECO|nr:hypothetical protein PR202_ga15777 [Eleusine coracana subsp. coracana]
MIYNYHINVEIFSSIKAVKYLYKYIYKGLDGGSYARNAEIEDKVINEIKQYRDARVVTPSESAYRLYAFSLYQVSPAVLQLMVHLPGMHMVAFKPKDDL